MRSLTLARWLPGPLLWAELFALSNLGFLAVDIYLAHSTNAFAHRAEWVPFVFSAAAPWPLLGAMALGGPTPTPPGLDGPGRRGLRRRSARWLGLLVGWFAIGVGVSGLLLHLDSQFFGRQTLKNLVYTAPFAAPLSYAGLGLLLLLDRMVDARSGDWARWVVLLALGGFVGNFVLSLADHAQNGFYEGAEWISVASAALAVGTLSALVALPHDRPLRRMALGVMALQVVVGVLGFALHTRGNLSRPGEGLWDQFLYGAPIFAPLLFADLAALAILGIWATIRTEGEGQA